MAENPNILYDNRARYGTITPSTEDAGFEAVNLRDWRAASKWKPTALPADVVFDAASLAWEFTNTLDGWDATNITLTPNSTFLNLVCTSANPQFRAAGSLSIDGQVNRYMVARIRRNAGSGWDGQGYYLTKRHTYSGTHIKTIADPTIGAGGAWVLAIWDMHDLTVGGDDWKKSTINNIRMDFGQSAADEFDVDWIGVFQSMSADYALFWAHDLGSQGVTVEIRGSVDAFVADDNLVATYDPEGDEPFALHWTSAEYRFWQIKLVAGFLSGNPAIGIGIIGEKFSIPAHLASGFDPIGRTPRGVSNKSVKGWPLGRVVEYEEFKEPLTFQFVTWTWVREMWLPVWREHLKDSPFVLTWDKTTYQNELHLVEATAGFETPHRSGQWATLSLSVQGLANE